MSYLKNLLAISFLSVFFSGHLMADHNRTHAIEIQFSLEAESTVFNNQTLYQGTYVTKEDQVFIDTGSFTILAKPLSDKNDFCNGNSFDNREIISLFGQMGIAEIDFRGGTAHGERNTFFVKNGSGVYRNWEGACNAVMITDCNAQINQFILQADVKTDAHCHR